MIERVYQLTCDACGETAFVEHGTVREFMRQYGWRTKVSNMHMCPDCWDRGFRWKDATLHAA